MVAVVPYNPAPTTVMQGAFGVSSSGLVQGQVYPEPAKIYELAGGVLAQTETICMYGGVGIYTDVPGVVGGPSAALGPLIGRATSLANLTGFSTWGYAYINNPQAPVPLAGSGQQVRFYYLGSGQRMAVACDPNLIELRGGLTNANVSWDFTNQMLVPYATTTVSSATVYQGGALTGTGTYNSTTGAVSVTTTNAHGLVPGDTFTIATTAGTGAWASLAGTYVATTGTTAETLNYTAATGLGTSTITAGSLTTNAVVIVAAGSTVLQPGDTFEISAATGTNSFAALNGQQVAALNTAGTELRFLTNATLTASTTLTGGTIATGGILPCSVLDIVTTNCMVVEYNATGPSYTWNFSGAAAIIRL